MPDSTPEAEGPFVLERDEEIGHVRILRIDRPGVRNALNAPVLAALAAALARADGDESVRSIVLTGGEEVFSAGADIDMLAGHSASSYLESENRVAFDRIRSARKPVVAAVAGYCLGGDFEIALGCDFIVASDSALFGQPEINLGFIPGAGGTQLWQRRTGAGPKAAAAMRGRAMEAFAARRSGLVDQVVPQGTVVAAATALAAELAAKAPLALRAAKASMRCTWSSPLNASLDHEVALMAGLLGTRNSKEGIAAFLERRPASFEGR